MLEKIFIHIHYTYTFKVGLKRRLPIQKVSFSLPGPFLSITTEVTVLPYVISLIT